MMTRKLMAMRNRGSRWWRSLRARIPRSRKSLARESLRQWNGRWSDPDFQPMWLDRPVLPQIVDAITSGWFPVRSRAIDLGCGLGNVTAFLAESGFTAVGVDLSDVAVTAARRRHGEFSGRLQFHAHDLCAGPIPGARFGVLVDVGCFHQIPGELRRRYAETLAALSEPDARLLMFCKAYRQGVAFGDAGEYRRVLAQVNDVLSEHFELLDAQNTFLDRWGGRDPLNMKPGIALRFRKR